MYFSWSHARLVFVVEVMPFDGFDQDNLEL